MTVEVGVDLIDVTTRAGFSKSIRSLIVEVGEKSLQSLTVEVGVDSIDVTTMDLVCGFTTVGLV